MPRHWQLGLPDSLSKEQPGPSCANSSIFQHTHCRAWLSPAAKVVAPRKVNLRKAQAVEKEGEKCEKQPCEHQGQRRRIGGRTLGTRAKIPLQPMVAWGGPMSEQEDAS